MKVQFVLNTCANAIVLKVILMLKVEGNHLKKYLINSVLEWEEKYVMEEFQDKDLLTIMLNLISLFLTNDKV